MCVHSSVCVCVCGDVVVVAVTLYNLCLSQLEDKQRADAKERQEKGVEWETKVEIINIYNYIYISTYNSYNYYKCIHLSM